ncbi:hypothetical protein CU254_26545 [Amycolatopsis sp. AA4]|uniref:hypothetical protein n=1 Tax=Actinomycetes TaxID=1760 RepID=UPI0001B55627|nr:MULTISPECIES: hypothetical protein [Actinomycetes]ATY13588.1 hypothetical protein CU254_26545 [Amycolatopsis sp. AA4]
MLTPTTLRELYYAVHGYPGSALFSDVLSPWLDEHAVGMREMLAPLAVCGQWQRTEYVWGDLLEQAYALSRISDLLLLGFQSGLPDGAETPFAHHLHLPEHDVRVTADEYVRFFSALGMRRVEVARFDPFFHEIAAVEQSGDPEEPIEIVAEQWPCLMFGELLFVRAGVRVRAGERHAKAGLADRSTLQESFLRRHRPTSDGSLGWGHNSQWKTDFRRDYLTADAYRFHVDANADIDHESPFSTAELTPAERRDLVRHRCAVTPASYLPEVEEPSADWRLTVPRN